MVGDFILSDYVAEAMALAAYDKLEDGSHSGRVPPCPGVVSSRSGDHSGSAIRS
jgi:hypothetical protein